MTDDTTKEKDEAMATSRDWTTADDLLSRLDLYDDEPEWLEDDDIEEMHASDRELVVAVVQLVRAERDAELQRAMVVVEAAVALPLCMLCDPEDGPIENEMSAHTETCPLVSQGFITTTGERR